MLYHDICDQDMDQAIGSLPGRGGGGEEVGLSSATLVKQQSTKRGVVSIGGANFFSPFFFPFSSDIFVKALHSETKRKRRKKIT